LAVIEAAALERVVDFARAVGGDDHNRRALGLDRAELGNGHLEVRQHLQQEGLERLVAAVEFVDQEHRRPRGVGLQRLQQRPLDQEALVKHVMLDLDAVLLALGLGGADGDHLRGIIPFVDRIGDVEPLVALQPDQAAAERLGQHLGDLGLADAGLALEEDRPAHLERQEQHGRERAVGEIVRRRQKLQRVVDGLRQGQWGAGFHRLQLTPSWPALSPASRAGPVCATPSCGIRQSRGTTGGLLHPPQIRGGPAHGRA
jgi:hypothetical protein